jgi:hypothetical protein
MISFLTTFLKLLSVSRDVGSRAYVDSSNNNRTPNAQEIADIAASECNAVQMTPDTTRRPNLEFQHAFDLCAVEARRAGGPIMLFADSAFSTQQLLKRLPDDTYSVPVERRRTAASSEYRPANSAPTTVVLTMPTQTDCAPTIEQIHQLLRPGDRVVVVAANWPARFLPELPRHSDPANQPASSHEVVSRLREGGYTVQAMYGFHGPSSIVWGYAAHLFERLGRAEIADRLHFRMRAAYACEGRQAHFAPISVVVAKR